MQQYVVVLTTVGSDEEAVKLARAVVERRVVACVNIVGPVRSVYYWKGQLEDERERLLLMKTRSDRFDDLHSVLKELHPYDVPEIIALPVERGSAAYLGWVDENVKRQSGPA